MRAVQFAQYGGPEVLEVVDGVSEPHPGSGQVRIAVRAAGVTPADWYLRSGTMQDIVPLTLPHIPGADAAGVVDEIGTGVTGVRIGDDVFGYTPPAAVGGALAEHAVLEAWAPKPASWSWEEAGGAAANIETATRVMDLLGVDETSTLLIEGAAGGVGTATMQLARARGAAVVGTASPKNHDFLRRFGAIPVEYGPGLAERVAVRAPGPITAVLDAAGSGSLQDLVKIAGSPDRVVSIADPQAASQGVRLSSSAGGGLDQHDGRAGLTLAARLAEEGRFSVPLHAVFPFARVGEAHSASQSRRAQGKIVILVS